jgi:hypothetical protein
MCGAVNAVRRGVRRWHGSARGIAEVDQGELVLRADASTRWSCARCGRSWRRLVDVSPRHRGIGQFLERPARYSQHVAEVGDGKPERPPLARHSRVRAYAFVRPMRSTRAASSTVSHSGVSAAYIRSALKGMTEYA